MSLASGVVGRVLLRETELMRAHKDPASGAEMNAGVGLLCYAALFLRPCYLSTGPAKGGAPAPASTAAPEVNYASIVPTSKSQPPEAAAEHSGKCTSLSSRAPLSFSLARALSLPPPLSLSLPRSLSLSLPCLALSPVPHTHNPTSPPLSIMRGAQGTLYLSNPNLGCAGNLDRGRKGSVLRGFEDTDVDL